MSKLHGDDSVFKLPKLNQHQLAFVTSKAKFSLGAGGYGSGKTTALVIRCIAFCIDTPWFGDLAGNRVFLGREREKDLIGTTLKDLFIYLPRTWIQKHYKKDGVICLKNGSEIEYKHLTGYEHLQSMNVGHAFVDQMEQIKWEVARALMTDRTRMTTLKRFDDNGNPVQPPVPFTMNGLTGVCNPRRTWLYPKFVLNEEYARAVNDPEAQALYNPRYKLFDIPVLGNVSHLPSDYIDAQRQDKSDADFERDVLGSWSKFEGQIYVDFTDDLVLPENRVPHPDWPIFIGIDHGGTGATDQRKSINITAVIFFALEHRDDGWDRVHIFDELYLPGSTIEETVAAIDTKLKLLKLQREGVYGVSNCFNGLRENVAAWRCDPSMRRKSGDTTESLVDAYIRHASMRGLSMPICPGDNDIAMTIHRVSWLYRKKLVDVNPKCKNYISETRSWEYGQNEKPAGHQADHAINAGGYAFSAIPMWHQRFDIQSGKKTLLQQMLARGINKNKGQYDPVLGRVYV